MRSNFEASLKHVLFHEGGFSNHPNDAGGPTQAGVIQSVYDSYRRRKGQVPRHVSLVTMDEVREIYKTLYWDKICGDELPIGIDYCVFDAAVNSGPSRGARWLQQAINKVAGTARLKVDENIGPSTLDASDDYDLEKVVDAMLDARLGFMKIARNTNTGKALWPTFGKGWSNRLFGYLPVGKTVRQVNGVDDYAKAMIRSAVSNSQPVSVAPEYKAPLPPKEVEPQGLGSGLIAALVAALAAVGVVQWALN